MFNDLKEIKINFYVVSMTIHRLKKAGEVHVFIIWQETTWDGGALL